VAKIEVADGVFFTAITSEMTVSAR